MANTVTMAGKFIQIIPDDTQDWYPSSTTTGEGLGLPTDWLCVKSIQFEPSAANDALVVNEGGLDGPTIMHVVCTATTDQKIKYFGNGTWMRPYIDDSDCTYGTATSCRILIELA
jgi:hypothetical protein